MNCALDGLFEVRYPLSFNLIGFYSHQLGDFSHSIKANEL